MLKQGRQAGDRVTLPSGQSAEVVRPLDDDCILLQYPDGERVELREAYLDPAYVNRLKLQAACL